MLTLILGRMHIRIRKRETDMAKHIKTTNQMIAEFKLVINGNPADGSVRTASSHTMKLSEISPNLVSRVKKVLQESASKH